MTAALREKLIHAGRERRGPVSRLRMSAEADNKRAGLAVGLADGTGGGQAVEYRHLDIQNDQVRTQADRKLDRRLAVASLADDLVLLFLEHLLEVEPDQRLVFGDHDTERGLSHPRSLP